MIPRSDDGPVPLKQEFLADLSVEGEENDDALIEKLRARACDPGRRFDTADLPVSWIAVRYGSAHVEQLQDVFRSYSSDGTVQLKSDVAEVTGYYADAPRGPLFPPISVADVEEAERRIGRRLPGLLRRVYTEVADGGFGPDSGLASLTDGNRAPGHLTDWPSAVGVRERNRTRGVPASWLHLAYGGCTMEWHLSLAAVGNPVLLYDNDGWVPHWDEDAHDGLRHATASLRRWLWTWADGGDVWDEALNRCSPACQGREDERRGSDDH
ncbi:MULTISPECIES: SMI1/KNR4 family protein [unclassified Streptomyces]|uniref:SMI1/KNR4 family protein n=1 Tax=unclassified Streptomyces TaxID=2593676 RepID=UPI0037FC323C